jgi:hypothetical protein
MGNNPSVPSNNQDEAKDPNRDRGTGSGGKDRDRGIDGNTYQSNRQKFWDDIQKMQEAYKKEYDLDTLRMYANSSEPFLRDEALKWLANWDIQDYISITETARNDLSMLKQLRDKPNQTAKNVALASQRIRQLESSGSDNRTTRDHETGSGQQDQTHEEERKKQNENQTRTDSTNPNTTNTTQNTNQNSTQNSNQNSTQNTQPAKNPEITKSPSTFTGGGVGPTPGTTQPYLVPSITSPFKSLPLSEMYTRDDSVIGFGVTGAMRNLPRTSNPARFYPYMVQKDEVPKYADSMSYRPMRIRK